MRLLDLFCGAGGAAMGYSRAGFTEIVGVDIKPQPRYPFTFVQGDALDYLYSYGTWFDAIHASPPCQAYSMASQQWRGAGTKYPDLLDTTRQALIAMGRPYVIENVPGAPMKDAIMLNGSMFGLKVNRRRYFESSIPLAFVLLPDDPPSQFRMGRPIREGDMITPVGHFSNIPYARRQMETPWMTGAEMTQAIPPAYTEFIGRQLLAAL